MKRNYFTWWYNPECHTAFICFWNYTNVISRVENFQEIPADYFNHPTILREDHLFKDTGSDDGHQWYYEGRGGWWQYDERTSKASFFQCPHRSIKIIGIVGRFFFRLPQFQNKFILTKKI